MNATTTHPPNTKPAPSYETLPPPRFAAEAFGREAAKRALRGVRHGYRRPPPAPGLPARRREARRHDLAVALPHRARRRARRSSRGPRSIKGMYYFDENFAAGDRWYRSHFPTVAPRRARAAAPRSPGRRRRVHAVLPVPPARARPEPGALVPDALIVVVLRIPSSARSPTSRSGAATAPRPLTFAEAIDARAEAPRRRGGAHPRGRRLRELRPPPLLLPRPGPVRADARALVRRVRPRPGPRRDQRGDVREPAGQRRPGHRPPRAAPPARCGTPSSYNAEPDESFDPEIRARLAVELAPDIAAVEALLGRKLPWGI